MGSWPNFILSEALIGHGAIKIDRRDPECATMARACKTCGKSR